jgi:hypothetical protein
VRERTRNRIKNFGSFGGKGFLEGNEEAQTGLLSHQQHQPEEINRSGRRNVCIFGFYETSRGRIRAIRSTRASLSNGCGFRTGGVSHEFRNGVFAASAETAAPSAIECLTFQKSGGFLGQQFSAMASTLCADRCRRCASHSLEGAGRHLQPSSARPFRAYRENARASGWS